MLESLQSGLAKVYAKYGGYARFASHLPDSARGRAEKERDRWHDAIARLQRVIELEDQGGDAARLQWLNSAFLAYTAQCRKLAWDAASARARRGRQRAAHDGATVLGEAVPTRAEAVQEIEVAGDPPAVAQDPEDLRRRAAAGDREMRDWVRRRSLL